MTVRRLWLAGAVGAVASGAAVALLATSAWLISRAAEQPPVLTLTVAAVLVRTLAITRAAGRYVERLLGHDAAFRQLTDLRVAVFARLIDLAPVGLARFSTGDLLARIVADVDATLDRTLRVILPWAQGAVVMLATVAFAWWLLPGVGAVVAVASLLGLLLLPRLVAAISAHAEARMAPARGDLSSAVVGMLSAQRELVAFGAVARSLDAVAERDSTLTRLAGRESASLGAGAGLGIAVQGAAVIGSLLVAIPAVADGRLAPVWLAVLALLPLAAYDVVMTLPSAAITRERVRASQQRLDEILASPRPVSDPIVAQLIPVGEVVITIRGMTASWGATDALRGIDLDVRGRERVAIVGPSGSGKSTLASVLMRFLDYQGSVRISGVELHDSDGDQVRGVIGYLSQDSHVFATTIADNLRIASPSATEDELVDVLERVQLGDALRRLPLGLETDLGEPGVALSGGERQRLALARLLLADRRLVVLDEPTEHLDPDAADLLARDLRQLDVPTILITHRMHEASQCDRILVLDAGVIVAAGTHAELLDADGWYADRWRAEADRVDVAGIVEAIPTGTAIRRAP